MTPSREVFRCTVAGLPMAWRPDAGWSATVRAIAEREYAGVPTTGPIAVCIEFVVPGSGDGPAYPLTEMAAAILNAMEGLAYRSARDQLFGLVLSQEPARGHCFKRGARIVIDALEGWSD